MSTPKNMDALEARKVLQSALAPKDGASVGELTIADAATKSGLSLRDAERGMHALCAEYRGHLRVTSVGELLFRFPTGFTKPWVTRDRLAEAGDRLWRGAVGVARFVVRAWIAIVLVGYVAIFLAILIAQMFASSDRRERGGGIGSGFAYLLWRVVFDALFWTFHPFSPFAYGHARSWGGEARRPAVKRAPEVPFYERVNRFFFGPTPPPPDPRAMERKILAAIRAEKGRIGLADVMRVTGLPRAEADPLMARLMLDYDGSVEVSEAGGITYRFQDLRKTAAEGDPGPAPPPVWQKVETLPPLTGNDGGANAIIVALNGFNLMMSMYALSAGLTLQRVSYLLRGVPERLIPFDGATPIALGVVPLVFSIALFALPIGRALFRGRKAKAIARENGRRALLREILGKVGTSEPITGEQLTRAWHGAAGELPGEKDITREVVALGGDVDIEGGAAIRYRFPDLEAEAEALEAERAAASEEEAHVGKVVFASDE